VNTSKTIKETFKRSISFDVRKLDNKNIWFSSVILIFLALTVFAIVACALEKNFIVPKASLNFRKNSIRLMVDLKLRELKHSLHSNKLSTHQDTNIQQEELLRGTSSISDNRSDSSGSKKSSSINESEQDSFVEELKSLLNEDPLSREALKVVEFKTLSFWELFKMIYLTHHFIWCLFFGVSSRHSKKTLIMAFLTHFVYVLALTMMLNFSMDRSGFTGYQMFIFKCFISPFLATFLVFIIKMLSKHETEYGMSFLNWCPKKAASAAEPPTRLLASMPEVPEERPNLKNKSTVHPTNTSKSFANRHAHPNHSIDSTSKPKARSCGQKVTVSDQPPLDTLTPTSPPKPNQKHFIWVDLEKPAAPKRSAARRVLIYLAYLLAIFFVPLCFLSLYQSVAAIEENNQEWPFGGWFFIQFIYELTIGKVPHCLFQLALFKTHLRLRHRSKLNSFQAFCKSCCSFILNSDIKDLLHINDSVHLEASHLQRSKRNN